MENLPDKRKTQNVRPVQNDPVYICTVFFFFELDYSAMYRACSVKITSARGYDVGIVQSVDGYKNLYFMYSHRQPPFDGDTADGTLLTLVAARPAKHDSKQESQRRKGTLIPGLLRRKLKICWEVYFSSLPLKSSHWRAHDHWNVGTQISKQQFQKPRGLLQLWGRGYKPHEPCMHSQCGRIFTSNEKNLKVDRSYICLRDKEMEMQSRAGDFKALEKSFWLED